MAAATVDESTLNDFWFSTSNISQSLATMVGIVANLLLLYMIRFVSLGDLRILTPLISVHSAIGILQTLLNALGSVRMLVLKGKFLVVLTGTSMYTVEPLRSILLTSVAWAAIFELLLAVINVFYRYLLVIKNFKPTVCFVVLLCIVGLFLACADGLAFMLGVTVVGPSNNPQLSLDVPIELIHNYSLWPTTTPGFLYADPDDPGFGRFFAVNIFVFIFCGFVIACLAWDIQTTILKRRENEGGRQVNALKYNRIMNHIMTANAIIPLVLYCLPLVIGSGAALFDAHYPHLGFVLSIPFNWMPAIKAITILLILPPWRRGFKYWWRRMNATGGHQEPIQTVRRRKPHSSKAPVASKNDESTTRDSKVMY